MLQVDLVIDGTDSVNDGFNRVSDIVVDGAGRVYVLDDGRYAVSVFDRDGRFVRRIGRRGRGPAEFLDPNGLALDADDQLYVYDPVQQRASVFDTGGRLARGFPLRITSWGPAWDGGLDAEGWLLDRQQVVRSDTVLEWSVRRLHLATGEEQRFPYPTCDLPGPTELHHRDGIAGVPYGARRLSRIDPAHGVWCAHSDRATAYRVPFGGQTPVDSFVSVAQAASVTAAMRAEARRSLESQPIPPAIIDEAMALVPPRRPLVEGLGTDPDGRLWMQVREERGSAFHVFSASGEWVARLLLREALDPRSIFVVRDGRLYVTVLDDMDVPRVHRYRLPASS